MKRILFVFGMLLTGVVMGQSDNFKKIIDSYISNEVPVISVPELAFKLDRDSSIILLDAREKNEYDVSHLKNANYVGYSGFKMKNIPEVSKDATIIVYCSIGARSEDIAKRLKDKGYENVFNLYGGIFEWVNQEYPCVDNKNQTTDNVHGYSEEWGIWVTKGEIKYE